MSKFTGLNVLSDEYYSLKHMVQTHLRIIPPVWNLIFYDRFCRFPEIPLLNEGKVYLK